MGPTGDEEAEAFVKEANKRIEQMWLKRGCIGGEESPPVLVPELVSKLEQCLGQLAIAKTDFYIISTKLGVDPEDFKKFYHWPYEFPMEYRGESRSVCKLGSDAAAKAEASR